MRFRLYRTIQLPPCAFVAAEHIAVVQSTLGIMLSWPVGAHTLGASACKHAILLYVDKSGSMGGKNIKLAVAALKEMQSVINECDYVKLALIDTDVHPHQPLRPPSSDGFREFIKAWESNLGDSTRIWGGVLQDVQCMMKSRPARGYLVEVIIITDGDDNSSPQNLGGQAGAHALLKNLRDIGVDSVAFSIIGIGPLPRETRERFETISELTGGSSSTVKDSNDVAEFKERFVAPLQREIADPQEKIIRARERAVQARAKFQISEEEFAMPLAEGSSQGTGLYLVSSFFLMGACWWAVENIRLSGRRIFCAGLGVVGLFHVIQPFGKNRSQRDL